MSLMCDTARRARTSGAGAAAEEAGTARRVEQAAPV